MSSLDMRILALAFLLFNGSKAVPPCGNGLASVKGRVMIEGAPLPGATVELRTSCDNIERSATSDFDGRFSFDQFPAGPTVAIRAALEGLLMTRKARKQLTFTLAPGETRDLQIEMEIDRTKFTEEICVDCGPSMQLPEPGTFTIAFDRGAVYIQNWPAFRGW
jgi:hypothetical protein